MIITTPNPDDHRAIVGRLTTLRWVEQNIPPKNDDEIIFTSIGRVKMRQLNWFFEAMRRNHDSEGIGADPLYRQEDARNRLPDHFPELGDRELPAGEFNALMSLVTCFAASGG